MISVYIPNVPIIKDKGNSSTEPRNKSSSTIEESSEERSLRRTRKMIRDYILCNDFTLFVTFTFAKNREDIDEKRKQLSNWLKNQQKRNQKFSYIAVPEFHKDGRSLHFHALFANYTGKLTPAVNEKTGRKITQHGRQVYSLPEFRLGFTNAKIIDSDDTSQSKVARYVTKYITKEMPVFKGKKRYFCSRELKTPKVINNPDTWYERIKPDWQIKTDSGTIMRFNAGSHPIINRLLGKAR